MGIKFVREGIVKVSIFFVLRGIFVKAVLGIDRFCISFGVRRF